MTDAPKRCGNCKFFVVIQNAYGEVTGFACAKYWSSKNVVQYPKPMSPVCTNFQFKPKTPQPK